MPDAVHSSERIGKLSRLCQAGLTGRKTSPAEKTFDGRFCCACATTFSPGEITTKSSGFEEITQGDARVRGAHQCLAHEERVNALCAHQRDVGRRQDAALG